MVIPYFIFTKWKFDVENKYNITKMENKNK